MDEEEKAKTLTDVLLSIKQICDDLLNLVAKATVKQQPPQSLEDLEHSIPTDLRSLLAFEETSNAYIIKPKQFLGTDNFVKVADIVRSLGGEYVSAGKESHFRVPRGKP